MATQKRASARPASLRIAIRVVPAWFCSPLKTDAVLPDADDGGDDADLEPAAFQRLALFDMRLEIADVAAAHRAQARAAGKADGGKRLAHGAAVVAVARGVDVGFADGADKGAAAEELAEMAFLVAP